jgi:Ca2+-binding RTX toxin-like protein
MRRIVAFAVVGASAVALAAVAVAAVRTGGPGADRVTGTESADVLRGRGGDDLLIGGRGEDRLIGGAGDDILRGGPNRDQFNMRHGEELASPGDDRIVARDGDADEISCGSGRDLAIVDSVEDGVYRCERIVEP